MRPARAHPRRTRISLLAPAYMRTRDVRASQLDACGPKPIRMTEEEGDNASRGYAPAGICGRGAGEPPR
jgi:hypothetical protein